MRFPRPDLVGTINTRLRAETEELPSCLALCLVLGECIMHMSCYRLDIFRCFSIPFALRLFVYQTRSPSLTVCAFNLFLRQQRMTVRFKKRKAAILLGDLSGRLARQGDGITAVCSVRPLSSATEDMLGKVRVMEKFLFCLFSGGSHWISTHSHCRARVLPVLLKRTRLT